MGEVMACDPYVSAGQFAEIRLEKLECLLKSCQILVLLTDHRQFKSIPHRILQEKVVVDTPAFGDSGISFRMTRIVKASSG